MGFYVERAYLVPVVEVDDPGVTASGKSLSGGEEAVSDRGERPRAGGGCPPRRCGGPRWPRPRPQMLRRAPAVLVVAAAP